MTNAPRNTDLPGLEASALGQGGYFDRRDAQEHGLTDHSIQHHVATGKFERVLTGVYRLAVAPQSPYDEYFRAWVWTNYRGAISHESALALYRLADILPAQLHVTVPRPFHRTSAKVRVHLGPLPEADVQLYEGIRVTVPARSIADAAASGTEPSQVVKAVHDALGRGLLTSDALRAAAVQRPNQHRRDIRPLIEQALADAAR